MKKTILVIILIFSAVSANDIKYSKDYQKCLDASGGVTVTMRECNAKELKYQDVRLNKAYNTAMKLFKKQSKIDLKKAQFAWLKYRKENCNFWHGYTDGTISSLYVGSCYVDETAKRADDLNEFISEGGFRDEGL